MSCFFFNLNNITGPFKLEKTNPDKKRNINKTNLFLSQSKLDIKMIMTKFLLFLSTILYDD